VNAPRIASIALLSQFWESSQDDSPPVGKAHPEKWPEILEILQAVPTKLFKRALALSRGQEEPADLTVFFKDNNRVGRTVKIPKKKPILSADGSYAVCFAFFDCRQLLFFVK
jgi:hypothetical protein